MFTHVFERYKSLKMFTIMNLNHDIAKLMAMRVKMKMVDSRLTKT